MLLDLGDTAVLVEGVLLIAGFVFLTLGGGLWLGIKGFRLVRMKGGQQAHLVRGLLMLGVGLLLLAAFAVMLVLSLADLMR